jgi:hypothetical protein
MPESPCPRRPSAVSALALFVDGVLPYQQNGRRKQSCHVFGAPCLRGRLVAVELIDEIFKAFQKHPVASFPNRVHRS